MSNPASVTSIISAGKGQSELMAELEKFRKTVIVMFTDIKGSTAYFEKYGDVAGLMMVHACNDALQKIVEAHGGRVIKFIGDAIMALFENDPKESLLAAIEMQKALIGFNAPKPEQDHVFIRIGLNYGNGIVKSNDVFGDVVNVASRVESAAQPEQIVISDTLYEQVKSGGFKLNSIGRFSLKGKEGDRDLYEVVWDEAHSKKVLLAHTKVKATEKASQVFPKFKLLHIKKDGSFGAEHMLKSNRLTMGKSQGDVQFPGDAQLAPLHARFYGEGNQLMVEDMSEGRGVYVRLIATYTLQNNDIIMMGRQVLKFKEKPDAMAEAASTGTTVMDMSSLLQEPVAQFVRILSDGKEDEVRFPLLEQEVTFGRNKGTYIFPDDGFMSRSHAKVYQRGDSFFLEDAGSRNGTFVKVVGAAPVPQGSMVLAGGQLMKVATL